MPGRRRGERPRAWADQDDELVRSSHLPAGKLAEQLGRTEPAVRTRASKLGISLATKRIFWTDDEINILRDPSLSFDRKVELTGRSRGAVSYKLSDLRRRGEEIICQRFCLDCGSDISDRGNQARRCVQHDAHSPAGNSRRYWEYRDASLERAAEWARKNPQKARDAKKAWAERNPDHSKIRYQNRSAAQRRVDRARGNRREAEKRAAAPQMGQANYRPWTQDEDN